MTDKFETHPDSLDGLAGDFRTVADRIGSAISGFQANAFEVGVAFGLLGACDGVATKYQSMTQHTVEGLRQVTRMLQADSGGLGHNAQNYRLVDQHTAQSFGTGAGA